MGRKWDTRGKAVAFDQAGPDMPAPLTTRRYRPQHVGYREARSQSGSFGKLSCRPRKTCADPPLWQCMLRFRVRKILRAPARRNKTVTKRAFARNAPSAITP